MESLAEARSGQIPSTGMSTMFPPGFISTVPEKRYLIVGGSVGKLSITVRWTCEDLISEKRNIANGPVFARSVSLPSTRVTVVVSLLGNVSIEPIGIPAGGWEYLNTCPMMEWEPLASCPRSPGVWNGFAMSRKQRRRYFLMVIVWFTIHSVASNGRRRC